MTDETSKKIVLLTLGQRTPMKLWRASQVKSKWTDVKQHNEQMNSAYKLLLTRVKKFYTGRNEHVFERDQRTDSSTSSSTMHTFLTKDLFLELECQPVSHSCRILYDFSRCPFEATIRKWLCEYPFSVASHHERCEGGVTAYFNRVLAYQRGKYFYNL